MSKRYFFDSNIYKIGGFILLWIIIHLFLPFFLPLSSGIPVIIAG